MPRRKKIEMEGEGVFQTLHKLGVSKKQVINEAKKIGRKALPMATTALGTFAGTELGNPFLGEELGRHLGNQLSNKYLGGNGIRLRKNSREGEGVFQTLHKLGVSKKKVIGEAKKVGHKVVDKASALAGQAVAEYTGNAQAGKAFEKLAKSSGKKLLETGSARDALSAGKSTAREIAKQSVKQYAEQVLPQDVSSAVHSAVESATPEVAEVETMTDGVDKMGSGFRKRVRRGGVLPYTSMPYKKAMSKMMVGGMMPTMGGMISPMSNIQTLSPYASIHSPQMSPFVPNHNPYKSGFKSGGSFLPAGHYGGSFLPA
jgi:hypothetical protein